MSGQMTCKAIAAELGYENIDPETALAQEDASKAA
jgi:hypothetical protein